MPLVFHILIFLFAIVVLWFFAGQIVRSVDQIAQRFKSSGFIVAFFLLGFLTSLGEISIALNAVLTKVPELSAGNLVGASFVLLLLIVPLLAVASGTVAVHSVFKGWKLAIVLGLIALPSLFLIDGAVTRVEGIATLIILAVSFSLLRTTSDSMYTKAVEGLPHKKLPLVAFGNIIISAGAIFGAGHLLVSEGVYFAELLQVPKSAIGIILLSIGTNIPEIAIALRSVLSGRTQVALGNYLGSAVMNTVIFALVPVIAGGYRIVATGFVITALFSVVGFTALYIFMRSKEVLSRSEGIVLLGVYILFIVFQVYSIATV